MTLSRKAGWVLVIFLALLTPVAAITRMIDMRAGMRPSPPGVGDSFDVRYGQNPGLTYLHLVPGVIFMVMGPFQFSKRIRTKWLNFHRWAGRLFVAIGLAMAVFGMIMAADLPAFGGLNTQIATYFFGFIFVFCIAKAYQHARHKRIALHREWMIRAFSIGLGVSTIRLVIIAFVIAAGLPFEQIFGIAFWLGWSINMIGAEVWINLTRPHHLTA